jgi:hypothetical protein
MLKRSVLVHCVVVKYTQFYPRLKHVGAKYWKRVYTLMCVTPCISVVLIIYCQQMHILYCFHTSLIFWPTCFDPCGSSSGPPLREHL